MPLPIALTSDERTYLAGPGTIKRFLSYVPTASNSVATAQVNGNPSTWPVASLTVDTTSAGWSGVAAGMTVYIGSAPGGHDRGIYRVRKAGNSTTLYIMEIAEGDPGLINGDLRTAYIADNDYITVYRRFDLWAVLPRIDYAGGTTATIYEDYDASVGSANTTPGPRSNNITINGVYGHYATQVANGATKAVTCIASPDLWPTSSSISTYAWTAPTAATGVSGTSTATLTMTLPVGFHVVKLVVTENNSATLTSYRMIWIHDDPDTGTFPALRIAEIGQDIRDRTGRRMTLSLSNTGVSNIPDGAMVMYWEQATWSGQTITSATTRFVGWILRNSWHLEPGKRSAECEIVGPAHALEKLGGYSQYFDTATSPASWQQVVSSLAYIDFMPWWLLRTRAANVLALFDYTTMGISNLTGRLTTWRLNASHILGQCQELATAYAANFGCDSLGNFFMRQHPSLILPASRGSQVVTRDTLDANLVHKIDLTQELKPQLRYLRGEGFMSDGVYNTPLLCEAPGKAPGQGTAEDKLQGQLVESQADLNNRTGFEYARRNNIYQSIQYEIQHNRDVYEPAHMQFVSLPVSSAYAPDNAGWTRNGIPNSVTKRHNDDGTADILPEFEGETKGVAGVYVPVPVAQTSAWGNYSNPLTQPVPFTPAVVSSYGARSGFVPSRLLIATSDGHVWRANGTDIRSPSTWTDISPSGTIRTNIGNGFNGGLIQNPFNGDEWYLFGQTGVAKGTGLTGTPTWTYIRNDLGPGGTHLIYQVIPSINFSGTWFWLDAQSPASTTGMHYRIGYTFDAFTTINYTAIDYTYDASYNTYYPPHMFAIGQFATNISAIPIWINNGTWKYLKSTNSGSSFTLTDTGLTLPNYAQGGGYIHVPFSKRGGGNNTAYAQYNHGLGNYGTGSPFDFYWIKPDGTLGHTSVGSISDSPQDYAFNSLTIDGNYLAMILNNSVSGSRFYRSTDGGATWAATASSPTASSSYAPRCESLNGWPTNPDFYLYTGRGKINVTIDAGATWTDVTSGFTAAGGSNPVYGAADFTEVYSVSGVHPA